MEVLRIRRYKVQSQKCFMQSSRADLLQEGNALRVFVLRGPLHRSGAVANPSRGNQPAQHLNMAVPGRPVSGFLRASLVSIVMQPLKSFLQRCGQKERGECTRRRWCATARVGCVAIHKSSSSIRTRIRKQTELETRF